MRTPPRYDKSTVRTIPVQLPTVSYNVHIGSGLLPTLGKRLAALPSAKKNRRIFVLTSPPIWALWGQQLLRSFPANAQPDVLFLPPGERWKRMPQIERLAEEMARAGADRASLLIAFGGGIVGDMGGFLAAVYMRGIPYVQVPTTLLAQVDSSVGGKTGANLAVGKNLVGAFHHPVAVYADVDTLRTLPARELRAGLMESVKAGIIRDKRLFALLEKRTPELLSATPDAKLLIDVVARSVAMKAEVVGADERESGLRMILNLGHTLGHAIEAATNYRALLHGEAVGWGMLAALRIGEARGLLHAKEHARAVALIHALGLLPAFRSTPAALLAAAGRDKKNSAGARRFVLPRGLGDAVVVEDVSDDEITEAAAAILAEARMAAPTSEITPRKTTRKATTRKTATRKPVTKKRLAKRSAHRG